MSDDVRLAAAKAVRTLLQEMRHEPDLRPTVTALLGRLGHATLVDWADADPEAVLEFCSALEAS